VIQLDGCGLQVTFCISVGFNAYETTAVGASSNWNNFGSALHRFAAARLELKQLPPQQRA
jgi:hypothetical protein